MHKAMITNRKKIISSIIIRENDIFVISVVKDFGFNLYDLKSLYIEKNR